jgi:hypothetical protein
MPRRRAVVTNRTRRHPICSTTAMGLLNRLRGSATSRPFSPSPSGETPSTSEITVRVVEDTHLFTAEDGSTLWCGGYTPIDKDGFFLTIADHQTSDPRCLYCNVAGTSHRQKALQDACFKSGAQITLRPEPTNTHDPNAIGVWDSSGTIHVGYVPAALSPRIAAQFRSGNPFGGLIVSEYRRDSEDGTRVGLHMLLAPLGALLLSIHSDEDEDDKDEGSSNH